MHLGKLLDWWNLSLFLAYLYDDDAALPMPVANSNNVLVRVSIVTFYYDMSCHVICWSFHPYSVTSRISFLRERWSNSDSSDKISHKVAKQLSNFPTLVTALILCQIMLWLFDAPGKNYLIGGGLAYFGIFVHSYVILLLKTAEALRIPVLNSQNA